MNVYDFDLDKIDKYTSIVIWGGGTLGKFVKSYLQAMGYRDLQVVDTKKFDNINIFHPMYISTHNGVIVIVAISGNEGLFNALNFLEIIGIDAYIFKNILNNPKNKKFFSESESAKEIECKYKYAAAIKSYNLYKHHDCKDDDLIYGIYKRNHVNASPERFHTLNYCITHKCTLICEKCGSFIPYEKEKKDDDINTIVNSFEKLSGAIDYIYDLGILGGEPFLHANLGEILEYFADNEQVINIHIVTNGTVIPDKSTLDLLYENNIKVIISDYPQSKTESIVEVLENAGVMYQYYRYDYWFDFYNPDISLGKISYAAMYELCQARSCWMIHHGRLGPCDVVTNLSYNDVIPDEKEDYIDLLDYKLTAEDIYRKIENLMSKEYLKGCIFCNGEQIKCDVAKQLR